MIGRNQKDCTVVDKQQDNDEIFIQQFNDK